MEQLKILRTVSEVEQLTSYLSDRYSIAVDTETDGVDKESHVIGISVCAETGLAYYVILSYWDKEQGKLVDLETKSVMKTFLQGLKGRQLVMHNGVFDCWMLENNFGVSLIDDLHTDTMVLAHLLDENRHVGLKDLGVSIFGENAKKEQIEMKESVTANGGKLTKEVYELYKADADLLGKYGAKDALLTYKLFLHLIPELYEQGLETFFYEEESMPLVKGPTYQLNTVGLRVDPAALQTLKTTLETEILEAKAFIYKEITPIVEKEYPGTSKTKTFNINSSQQLAWLLHEKLGEDFGLLTEGGKELCHALNIKIPYNASARRDFIYTVRQNYDRVYAPSYVDEKGKLVREKKVKNFWAYIQCGSKAIPPNLIEKYEWVRQYYLMAKNQKLLGTYVEGIQSRLCYNIIRPSFLQCGTTSGRYSSKEPNFQNLPRTEKRIKSCIISRPGKVFIGADYSQLEPRVFASLSGDTRLLDCFKSGEDFYSVIGMEVFEKYDCSPVKDEKDSFATKYPKLRDLSKVIALSTPYGTTAPRMAPSIGKTMDEAQEIIDAYLEKFESVHAWMLSTHEEVKANGQVLNLFGRPRRMPLAKNLKKIYGNTPHSKLPYEARSMLNLSVNHKCQSTGASIINRSAIAFLNSVKLHGIEGCNLVLNVHDELVVECKEIDAPVVKELLQKAMQYTCVLPGVDLLAIPVIAKNLKDLK
jgi:DNA polymerase I-like protein with 3'-5' exonuclease and polymerase domains